MSRKNARIDISRIVPRLPGEEMNVQISSEITGFIGRDDKFYTNMNNFIQKGGSGCKMSDDFSSIISGYEIVIRVDMYRKNKASVFLIDESW